MRIEKDLYHRGHRVISFLFFCDRLWILGYALRTFIIGAVSGTVKRGSLAASVRITIFFNHLGGVLYRYLRERLAAAIAPFLLQKYGLGGVLFAIEETPRVELGAYALPLAFQLAKRLKRATRASTEASVIRCSHSGIT